MEKRERVVDISALEKMSDDKLNAKILERAKKVEAKKSRYQRIYEENQQSLRRYEAFAKTEAEAINKILTERKKKQTQATKPTGPLPKGQTPSSVKKAS